MNSEFITEFEWLVQNFSKKEVVPSKFSFALPQTVMMKDGLPNAWYYSMREGSKYIVL